MLIGVIAALVIRNVAAAPTPQTPRTWVSIITALAGVLLLAYAMFLLFRRSSDSEQIARVTERMSKVASAPAAAIIAAGAALANPGVSCCSRRRASPN
jgi:hypothetical protein